MTINTTIKYIQMAHYVDNAANLTYSTPDAACFDICAAIPESMVLRAGQRQGVPTGVKVAPENPLWLRINSRSGLAIKHGIITIGGIIDTDYRGEIIVIMLNTSEVDYVINSGDKIAQVELPFPYKAEFEEISVAEFEQLETNRGAKGFGSSGK